MLLVKTFQEIFCDASLFYDMKSYEGEHAARGGSIAELFIRIRHREHLGR